MHSLFFSIHIVNVKCAKMPSPKIVTDVSPSFLDFLRTSSSIHLLLFGKSLLRNESHVLHLHTPHLPWGISLA